MFTERLVILCILFSVVAHADPRDRAAGKYPVSNLPRTPRTPVGEQLFLPELPLNADGSAKKYRDICFTQLVSDPDPFRATAEITRVKWNFPTPVYESEPFNFTVVLGPWTPGNASAPLQCPLDPTMACARIDLFDVWCAMPEGVYCADEDLAPWWGIPPNMLYNTSNDFAPFRMCKNCACDTSPGVKRQILTHYPGFTEFSLSFYPTLQPQVKNPDTQAVVVQAALDVTAYTGVYYGDLGSNTDRLVQGRIGEEMVRAKSAFYGVDPNTPGADAGQSMGGASAIINKIGNQPMGIEPSPYERSVTLGEEDSCWWLVQFGQGLGGYIPLNGSQLQLSGQDLAFQMHFACRGENLDKENDYIVQVANTDDPHFTSQIWISQIAPLLNATIWGGTWVHPAVGSYPPTVYSPEADAIYGNDFEQGIYYSMAMLASKGYGLTAYDSWLSYENMLARSIGKHGVKLYDFQGGIPDGNTCGTFDNLALLVGQDVGLDYSSSLPSHVLAYMNDYPSYWSYPCAKFWMNPVRVNNTISVTITPTPQQQAHPEKYSIRGSCC